MNNRAVSMNNMAITIDNHLFYKKLREISFPARVSFFDERSSERHPIGLMAAIKNTMIVNKFGICHEQYCHSNHKPGVNYYGF